MIIWDDSNTPTTTKKDIYADAFTCYSRLPLPAPARSGDRSGAPRRNPRHGAAVSRDDKEALVYTLYLFGHWLIGTIVVCIIILLAVALMGDTPRDHVGQDEEYHARQGRRLTGGGL